MKKILVTTLALSLAVVSGLDARVQRVTKRRGASTHTTQKEVARTMNANAADLQNPNVAKADKKDAASELLALFQNNPDEAQLAKLYIQRKQKMNEIQAKKDAIKAMNVGWFDFSNVDHKKAKGELGTLNTELKDINQQISAQEKVVGRESSNAVRNAVGGLIVVMGIVAVDHYFFGGEGRKYITTKAGEFGTYVAESRPGKFASGLYESGKGMVSSGWNRLRGNTAAVVVPAGTPVVEQPGTTTVTVPAGTPVVEEPAGE